jgi:transcription-repair coupling factor (superfamily II helicase)
MKTSAKRKTARGFAFSADTYLQAELESSFIYEDTPDQAKATADVKMDMEKPHPMDRLVCGDVGFGKTEIAIRAAFVGFLEAVECLGRIWPLKNEKFRCCHYFSNL